jgi:hypothetical protein
MNTRGEGVQNQLWTLKAYPGEIPIFKDNRFIVDDGYVRIQGLHLTGTAFFQAVSWSGLHDHIEFLDNDFSGAPGVPIYFNANKGVIQGNIIHTNLAVHGIYVMHGDSNVIRDNYVTGIEKYGIHIYDENKYSYTPRITNLLVENNTVIGSLSRSGIIISAGQSIDFSIEIDGVLVRNNIVTNNFEDGITIRYYGSIRNIDIYNNVMYENGADGLRISAENVDSITVKNNILSSNGLHIDVSSNLDNLEVSHNLYWLPTSIGTDVKDDHAVYEDPLFLNVNEGDFHLGVGSPAIDAGVDVGIPYNGSAPDLGAFESGLSKNDEPTGNLPNQFDLQQNYPNPFNQFTKIYYSLAFAADVDLSLFDVSGKRIRTLVREKQISGLKSVKWNGRDEYNNAVSSGIYFFSLHAGEFSSTKKMLLIR